MSLYRRLKKLEEEYLIIDQPIVRIYQKDRIVKLSDGREMTVDEYKSLVASGEISADRKEILIRTVRITKTLIIKNGSCR